MTAYNHAEFSIENSKRVPLTDEERRLIDEEVAAGRVQKIPTGKSALDEEYIWGKTARGYEGLVRKNPLTRAEALAKFKKRLGSSVRIDARVAERRAEVLRLTREGFTAQVIADFLGCSSAAVKKDRKYWQDNNELPKLSSSGGLSQDDIQQRRAKVLEMIKAGMSHSQIAAHLGVGKGAVANDRAVLRAEGKL
ncbi:helix-turn-helix domain-containing protein [Ruegeria sp. HKCCA4812]|uniref:helix-turn-helix domain-containing protein n=1 Tax=Ruegeria sp. HKCCA4812 TaxID=2682993 RepID=UPI0014876F6F|nr:helix-turn-helix domain-containing protein [Ruegeria sp. HKCCA4812]